MFVGAGSADTQRAHFGMTRCVLSRREGYRTTHQLYKTHDKTPSRTNFEWDFLGNGRCVEKFPKPGILVVIALLAFENSACPRALCCLMLCIAACCAVALSAIDITTCHPNMHLLRHFKQLHCDCCCRSREEDLGNIHAGKLGRSISRSEV